VHWVVRRVPTHLARELTATATGAVIGLGSAWFELRLIPRHVRSMTVGGLLLVRTFFYVTLCAVVIHAVTMSLLGLSEHGGVLAYYTSEQYRDLSWAAGSWWRWGSSRWRASSSTSSGSSTGCSVRVPW
jgi:hypothetical protein